MRTWYQLLAESRTRPTCLIAGLALLFLSLIYCGGLAAIVLVDRDPGTGRLVPRWERHPTPTVVATPGPSSRLSPNR